MSDQHERPAASPGGLPLCVVLVRTRNPLNIGAAARAMVNFGFRDLRLVQPFEDSWREARSAVGASAVLESARVYASLADAIADCSLVVGTSALEQRRPDQPVWLLPEWQERLSQVGVATKVGLVFGSEKHGLTRQHLSYCHAVVRIATDGTQPSMNLGQAVAVCLYEVSRSATAVQTGPSADHACGGDLERLTQTLNQLLSQSGYVKPGAADVTEIHVREMIRRLRISRGDAHLLTGMLARVLNWRKAPER